MNRRRFLAAAGAVAVAPAALARPALAAPSEGELAYANFAIAAEYLMEDYYAKALEAGLFHGSARAGMVRARFNEGEHAEALAALLTDAAQSAPAREDFEFTWPARTFDSQAAAAGAGVRIESAVVGAYLSAVTTISLESYRSLFARAAADEAQHLAVVSWVATGKPVGNSFPQPLDLEEASNVLGPYLG